MSFGRPSTTTFEKCKFSILYFDILAVPRSMKGKVNKVQYFMDIVTLIKVRLENFSPMACQINLTMLFVTLSLIIITDQRCGSAFSND